MSSRFCKKCSKKTFHDERWDAYFCVLCNHWNEGKCGDGECSYCVPRPSKPLQEDLHETYIQAYKELGFDAVEWLVYEVHNE